MSREHHGVKVIKEGGGATSREIARLRPDVELIKLSCAVPEEMLTFPLLRGRRVK